MKKISILTMIAFTLVLASCGPSAEDKKKVCGCEELFVKMKNMEGEYQINDQMNSGEAEKKAQAQNQEAYEKCVKLHKDIGDDEYSKISQKCSVK